jgi:hypothetical protein
MEPHWFAGFVMACSQLVYNAKWQAKYPFAEIFVAISG